jgi:molecular chaperone DnaK
LVPVKNALKDAGLKASDIDEVILVGGSTRTPAVRAAVEKHFGKTANSSVNPDEVVALGAAVQGGVFSGDVNDILLLDVTPLSLGIETLGGVCTKLIERNTTIPCQKSEVFSTAADSQSSVDIHVIQGEREFANDNRTLGQFRLDGIPPAPRGIPQVEVTFDIDANGIVSVSARDKATGKEQSISITSGGTLSDAEVDQMITDAADHEADDQKKKELIEATNKLDSLVYQAEKLKQEQEDNFSADALASLDMSLGMAKAALDTTDLAQLTGCYGDLEKSMHVVGQELYTANNASEDSSAGEDDTIDAEYEEVEP